MLLFFGQASPCPSFSINFNKHTVPPHPYPLQIAGGHIRHAVWLRDRHVVLWMHPGRVVHWLPSFPWCVHALSLVGVLVAASSIGPAYTPYWLMHNLPASCIQHAVVAGDLMHERSHADMLMGAAQCAAACAAHGHVGRRPCVKEVLGEGLEQSVENILENHLTTLPANRPGHSPCKSNLPP